MKKKLRTASFKQNLLVLIKKRLYSKSTYFWKQVQTNTLLELFNYEYDTGYKIKDSKTLDIFKGKI